MIALERVRNSELFFHFHSYLHQLKHVMTLTYINKGHDIGHSTVKFKKQQNKTKRPTPKRQTKDNMIIWWIKD